MPTPLKRFEHLPAMQHQKCKCELLRSSYPPRTQLSIFPIPPLSLSSGTPLSEPMSKPQSQTPIPHSPSSFACAYTELYPTTAPSLFSFSLSVLFLTSNRESRSMPKLFYLDSRTTRLSKHLSSICTRLVAI